MSNVFSRGIFSRYKQPEYLGLAVNATGADSAIFITNRQVLKPSLQGSRRHIMIRSRQE